MMAPNRQAVGGPLCHVHGHVWPQCRVAAVCVCVCPHKAPVPNSVRPEVLCVDLGRLIAVLSPGGHGTLHA